MKELVLASDFRDAGRRKLEAVRACQERDLVTLEGLLNAWVTLRSRKRNRTSPKTREKYLQALRYWVAWCWPDPEQSPNVNLLRATETDVETYVATLQETLKPATVQLYLSGVRAVYRALVWAGAVEASPAKDVMAPGDPRPAHERRAAVPMDGYLIMLEHANVRDTLLLRLMGDTGLRISEVAALDLADVRGGLVTVEHGKGGKSRRVPMTKATAGALAAWLAERQPAAGETALLVNTGSRTRRDLLGRRMSDDAIRKAFHRLRTAAKLPDELTPHSLRHLAGTRVYRATRDLHRVSQVLGHSSVSTSAIYSKMDLSDIQEAMSLIERDE